MAVGKFERSEKDHLSMFSKLGLCVRQCNRNDTFLRAFVKSLPFFASRRASAVGNVAGDCIWRDQPAPRRLGPRSVGVSRVWAAACPLHQRRRVSSRCGVRSLTWSRLAKTKNDRISANARKNVLFILRRWTRNLRLRTWIGGLHIALEFSDCDEPFVREPSESGEIGLNRLFIDLIK